ncbi:hypothetical protein [Arcanobacterium pinnipediorum]|uniref:Uncharacterized protein n=1 Tax=Arcanobacterium pinnipediorum TaxID=1503041 RepID=A0ABY5AFT7_9ACTO|nr:hypothetical protein [Arcanobacterium pinnipediorum]USR78735.1 hypothetical protein NG665_04905 [Arcanobacterium pinnipediorum]
MRSNVGAQNLQTLTQSEGWLAVNSARRYLILTPFNNPKVIAGVAKLRGIEAVVVPTASGVALVRELPVPSFDDWDISELLGESVTQDGAEAEAGSESLSDNPQRVAALFSELSAYGVVLITADLGDDVGAESGTSGLVNAVRFINGQRSEDIPGGLLLNSLDPMVESLILGQQDPAEVAGAITQISVAEIAEVMREVTEDTEQPDA